ncbi:MAG: Rpn family recombination-promoting nuclease/putative transposase [Oscillatoria princeps RMCB-10]|jgi:hypothetical protein|nr:Rpn family recombination-promoting nuclease/putative transposase [Oscillatoria princeps RMCB-10]
MAEIIAEYDESWKEAIETYFQEFLRFFFPDIHNSVDWTEPYVSLAQELQEIVGESETGDKITDRLFQVKLLTGQPAWILIHVEVQSQYESGFAERIYIYNYRAFDKHRQPVVSVAILGDERPSWRPQSYGYALDGYELSLKFPTVKLLDYQERWPELESSTNPFALMVMAHLKTKATTGDLRERQRWKWAVVRALVSKGYSRNEVVNLFRFVDRMMALPEELQREFKTELIRQREEGQMPFISRVEEMAKEEGRQEATRRTLREETLAILEVRFNAVPPEVADALNGIDDPDTLRRLHRAAITIASPAEFQQLISAIAP